MDRGSNTCRRAVVVALFTAMLATAGGGRAASPVGYNDQDGATFVRSSADGFNNLLQQGLFLPGNIATEPQPIDGSLTIQDDVDGFVDNEVITSLVSSTTGIAFTSNATTAWFHYNFNHLIQTEGNGGVTISDAKVRINSSVGPLYAGIFGQYATDFTSSLGGTTTFNADFGNGTILPQTNQQTDTGTTINIAEVTDAPVNFGNVFEFQFLTKATAIGPGFIDHDNVGSNGSADGWITFVLSTQPIEVPEPASATLLLGGTAMFLRRRGPRQAG